MSSELRPVHSSKSPPVDRQSRPIFSFMRFTRENRKIPALLLTSIAKTRLGSSIQIPLRR